MSDDLRPSVRRFAALMEKKLRENDHKSGWDEMTFHKMLHRLDQEVGELHRAVEYFLDTECDGPQHQAADEAADVGNFAMMIVDRLLGPLEQVAFVDGRALPRGKDDRIADPESQETAHDN